MFLILLECSLKLCGNNIKIQLFVSRGLVCLFRNFFSILIMMVFDCLLKGELLRTLQSFLANHLVSDDQQQLETEHLWM